MTERSGTISAPFQYPINGIPFIMNGGDEMKLYLDPGHGGQDSGARGHGLNEKDVTLDIALKLQQILLHDYENVQVKMSRTTDTTKGLDARTNEANAWGADFFLAIHINSANAAAQGYEDYIYSGLSSSSTTAKYQNIIHEEVLKMNRLTDRGKKKANFHVLRESKMPAMLTENGFIDNAHDAALMKESSWRQEVAQGHANGLAKAFGLKRKATATPKPTAPSKPATPSKPADTEAGTLYKVMVGSFKSRENAEERVTELSKIGMESIIVSTKISGATWYRVQVGAFSNRANAETLLNKVEKAGFDDSFIVIEKGNTADNTSGSTNSGSAGNTSTSGNAGGGGNGNTSGNTGKPGTEPNPTANTDDKADQGTSGDIDGRSDADPVQNNPSGFTILGPTFLSPEHMNLFVKKINPNAPELGSYYLTFGEYYGIRGDVAFAQAILETNYFRFTGDVQPEQNNFAGLGATGNHVRGASFTTPEEGVLAHLQHLYAYATKRNLPGQYPLVDPRFDLVDRGSAPTWVALNGKWAVPGKDYGQNILDIYERMIHTTIQHLETTRNTLTP